MAAKSGFLFPHRARSSGGTCGAVFVNLGSGSGETVRSSGRSSRDPNPAALGLVYGICA